LILLRRPNLRDTAGSPVEDDYFHSLLADGDLISAGTGAAGSVGWLAEGRGWTRGAVLAGSFSTVGDVDEASPDPGDGMAGAVCTPLRVVDGVAAAAAAFSGTGASGACLSGF
jgi:hypothetical protein